MSNKITVDGKVTAGGNINVQQAEGDIIGSIQIATQTTSIGFKQEQDKAEFLRQVEELRGILRQIQEEMKQLPGLNQDAKEEIDAVVSPQIFALNKTKDEARSYRQYQKRRRRSTKR